MIRLDHYTLRTRKPEETVRFYCAAVGLTEGWRPGFRFPGHWLYLGDRPVVHIVSITDNENELRGYTGKSGSEAGSGSIDHIAFRCDGLADMQERLLGLGLPFRERVVPDLEQHQLFVQDPNGVTIELVFDHAPENQVRGEKVPAPVLAKAR